MNYQNELNKIKEKVAVAQEILVVLNKKPELDAVAAALSLYLGLLKQDKRVTVVCEEPVKVELSDLIGVNKITNALGGKNFIISLDYKKGVIDKVSYNIEDDKFNLVIEPRPDAPPIDEKSVHYSYSGAKADLIFIIGASSFEDLGKVYEGKKEAFVKEKIVSINRENVGDLGEMRLAVTQAASLSEIIAFLLRSLGIKFDRDIAQNLLAGVIAGSNNFASAKTNAMTFETAALSLRAGATRKKKPLTQTPKQFVTPKSSIIPPTPLEGKREELPTQKSSIPDQSIGRKPLPVKKVEDRKEGRVEEKKAHEDKKEKAPSFIKTAKTKDEKAPPDWLKPKIYKSSTLL